MYLAVASSDVTWQVLLASSQLIGPLVSALLTVATALRAALEQDVHPVTIITIALLPLIVFGWVAVDNVVFLFSPVRYVPGQGGALQNAGRGLVLMLIRFGRGGRAALLGAAAYLSTRVVVTDVLGAPPKVATTAAALCIWFSLLFLDAGLVLVGGVVGPPFRRGARSRLSCR